MDTPIIENFKLKQCPFDTWTTREHLCLTSAVSQSGDQNWVAVSRAIRQLTTETDRPADWYSTKNCALQYAKLLEQIDTPKRKREKGEGPLNETPGEIVTKMLSKKRVEELKGILEEERVTYLQLRKEVLHLESNQLDNRLHQYWDEIMREREIEEEEAARLQEFLREREEKIKIFQAASKLQIAKAHPISTLKKNLSPAKVSSTQNLKKQNSSENLDVDCTNMEEEMETEVQSSLGNNSSTCPSATSVSQHSSSTSPDKTTGEKNEEDETAEKDFPPEVKEEERLKLPEVTIEDIKCEPSFETNITLDYTSNLRVEMKDEDHISPDEEKKLVTVVELIKEEHEMGLKSKPEPSDESSERVQSAKEEVNWHEEKAESEDRRKEKEEADGEEEEKDKEDKEEVDIESEKKEKRGQENVKEEEEEEDDDDDDDDDDDEEEEEEGKKINKEGKRRGRKKKGQVSNSPKEETKANVAIDTPEANVVVKKEAEDTEYEVEGKKGPGSFPDAVVMIPLESCEKEVEKKVLKKEGKDEYDFDDDASRESIEVKRSPSFRDYMNRSDKRKFSLGESVSSPVVSESTPSSPASTNYGDDPEAEKMHRSWKRSIMLIWNDIAAHKNASIFLKPITEDKVPGYHSIVFRPIDLMTIKRNIENGTIRSTPDFHRDIMLMFLNAKMYNTKDHNIYRMAEHMMNDAVDIIEEFIQAQMLAKVVETPQKTLRRETRESSAKRVGEDMKRKREEREEKAMKRRKI